MNIIDKIILTMSKEEGYNETEETIEFVIIALKAVSDQADGERTRVGEHRRQDQEGRIQDQQGDQRAEEGRGKTEKQPQKIKVKVRQNHDLSERDPRTQQNASTQTNRSEGGKG